MNLPIANAARNWEIIQGRLSGTLQAPGSVFDKNPTTAILVFEVLVLLGVAAVLLILPRFKSRLLLRFGIVAGAVLIFELFTGPMWRNLKMGSWAYLYQQVSWILTLGWSALILGASVLVDHLAPRRGELARFAITLAILTPVVFGFELLLHGIGLRQYAPEVWESVSGVTLLGLPVETFYYVPVFLSLILGFYKYWSFVLDDVPVMPNARIPWLRTLWISAVAVLFFELMIEPMVRNEGFPRWSYLYNDITVLMTGFWIVVLWLATNIVDRRVPHWGLGHRFLAYLGATALVAIPAEGWFIASGLRVYGPSAQANFSGLTFLGTEIPLEVCFAIPLYFALVLGLLRFAEIAISNRELL